MQLFLDTTIGNYCLIYRSRDVSQTIKSTVDETETASDRPTEEQLIKRTEETNLNSRRRTDVATLDGSSLTRATACVSSRNPAITN